MKRPAQWFHGDASRRSALFIDQRWDRPRGESSGNAEGPGLYFTSSLEDAQSYGPYLYVAELKPSFKLLPARKPSQTFLFALYNEASDEDRETFLSNWATTNPRTALAPYLHQNSMHDAAATLYHDLFQYSPKRYVNAMVAAGYDGVIVPRKTVKHLVVWNPRRLDIWHVEE